MNNKIEGNQKFILCIQPIKYSVISVHLIEACALIIQVKYPLFVCFVALRPKSTAIVMAGRSVHLTTLTSTSCTYFLVTDNNP